MRERKRDKQRERKEERERLLEVERRVREKVVLIVLTVTQHFFYEASRDEKSLIGANLVN